MPIRSYIRALLLLMVFFSGGCDNGSDIPVIDFSRTIPKKVDHQQPAGPELRVAVASMVSPEETYLLYNRLLQYIGRTTGREVVFVQRKTYQEVNDLLLKGRIDLAFICSGPYAIYRGKKAFQALATPVIRGSPLYSAYLVINKDSQIGDLGQLRGKVFAFTDPESNTGRLVPLYWLHEMGERPDEFFGKYIFTYSHSNSIMAVSRSLVDGASVDGLIWDYLSVMSPARVARTVINVKYFFLLATIKIPGFIYRCNLSYAPCSSVS